MKNIKFGAIVLIFLTVFLSTAQDKPAAAGKKTFYPHNIGAAAGFVTGYGLSYRHWFPNRYGFQLTFAPFYSNTDSTKFQSLSAGLTALRIFKQSRFVNLFGYAGVHGYYRYNEFIGEPSHKTKMLYLGAGPGFDIHFWHLSVNIMFGLTGRLELPDNFGGQFSAETALYYSF